MASPMFRSNFHKYRKIFRALFARAILATHAWFAIYLTAMSVNEKYFGLLIASIFLFILETTFILYFYSGCELKRFCTSFMVYLLSIIPALWIQRQHSLATTSSQTNSTHNHSTPMALVDTTTNKPFEFQVANANQSQILSGLKEQGIASLMEQSMMFIIILCRWLLPRGRIDRNSLSQLLIMYSGISADILDFSEIFDKDEIRSNETYKIVILGVWSWSLLQFTLVVTSTFTFRRRQRVPSMGGRNLPDTTSEDKSETLSILMVFFMQDGPFLVARCYAIFLIGVSDYLMVFFSLKNGLTLVLAIYRLFVLCGCVTNEGNDLLSMEEIAKSKESLDIISEAEPKSKTKKKKKEKQDKSKSKSRY